MKGCLSTAVLAALALSACSKKEPTPTERFAERALQSARDLMNDPDAVKFKDVRALPSAKCMYGKILGKNGFGAYAGYRNFVWVDGKIFLEDSDLPGEVTEYSSYLKNWIDCSGEALNLKRDQYLVIPQA